MLKSVSALRSQDTRLGPCDILPAVPWPLLNLALAALAFLVVLYGTTLLDWRVAVPAGVMALVFGLEWVGVPVLGRWRRKQEGQEPPADRQQAPPPGRREHVGPFWRATQKDKAVKPTPPTSKLSKRPPNSRPRPRREERW